MQFFLLNMFRINLIQMYALLHSSDNRVFLPTASSIIMSPFQKILPQDIRDNDCETPAGNLW